MTRSELIQSISLKYPHLYETDVERLVATILGTMKKSLIDGRRIELRNFGIFSLKQKASHNARNPKSGEKVIVPPKVTPCFHAGKILKDKINKA